jgi:peptidyl-prolyl cis-trans isomerase B (cyclophilin B)
LYLFLQDLYGLAEPAIPGDELDITTTPSVDDVVNIAEVSHASSTKAKIPGLAAATGSADGLSMGQKLFFIVAIVAVCVLFLKSRNGGQSNIIGGLKEKSMA